MAELADAYGSGPYFRKKVQVRFLLGAPKIRQSEDCLIFIQSEGLVCNLAIASMFFLIVQYSLAN